MYLTDVGNWLNSFLLGYVAGVVSELAAALWPLAVLLLTLYITNYGLAVMRGEVSEPIEVFAWKVVKLGFILTFALGSAFYVTNVNSAFESLQDGMATMFISGGGGGQYGTVTGASSAFGALDLAFQQGTKALDQIWDAVSLTSLDLLAAGMIYTVGLDIFLIVAAAVTVISKVFLAFALSIGPAAILCLMFKPSAKFFDAWLAFALSAVVMAWFVYFALGLSLFVVTQVIEDLALRGAFTPGSAPANAVSPITGSIAMLVIYVLMAVLIFQSPRLASALTGGPAMSTGAGMIASYIAGSSGRGGGGQGGGSGGGNRVGQGGGGGYAGGHSAGYAFQRVSSLFGSGRR